MASNEAEGEQRERSDFACNRSVARAVAVRNDLTVRFRETPLLWPRTCGLI